MRHGSPSEDDLVEVLARHDGEIVLKSRLVQKCCKMKETETCEGQSEVREPRVGERGEGSESRLKVNVSTSGERCRSPERIEAGLPLKRKQTGENVAKN